MSRDTLTVALIQRPCSRDPAANLAAQLADIATAAAQGAELVVLQELHNSRYFCIEEDPDQFDLAEPIPGPSTAALGQVAQQHGVVIVASLFERRAAGLYHNTAVVFERDGSIAGRYRKMHIPDDPGFSEKFYFTPGDLGFTPIDTSVGRLGVLICWDQWYPEAARLMALAGAELLIYPTAIGWDPDDTPEEQQRQLQAWQTIQRSHAIANALPVVSVNRVGAESSRDGAITNLFWGHSFICGTQGEILVEADSQTAAILTATLDTPRTERVRRIWPFLRDRRIESYSGLLHRYLD